MITEMHVKVPDEVRRDGDPATVLIGRVDATGLPLFPGLGLWTPTIPAGNGQGRWAVVSTYAWVSERVFPTAWIEVTADNDDALGVVEEKLRELREECL